MGFKRALVAYDGSDHAKMALDIALELVESVVVRDIIILYVSEGKIDPFLESEARITGVPVSAFTQSDHDALTTGIASLTRGYEDAVEIMITIGLPKDEILRTVKEHNCDLVIMGSRGLGAIRGMVGSVSYAVLRDSDVPVFIAK